VILLIDNYDSFVHNLARYFQRLGQATEVVRNDALTVAEVRRLAPSALVISPGPCTPREAGISLDLVRELHPHLPILGVCLGHQVIGEAFGGRICRAPRPIHGQAGLMYHRGESLLAGIANPFSACRYHSLIVDSRDFPSCLQVLAWTADGLTMALRHRQFAVMGVQFHPESVLTPPGYQILAGFLRAAGIPTPPQLPHPTDELWLPPTPNNPVPARPVTF
jgi:anthranilate synthase/aminodeoxychorismate synthase-like glutamine amidotransferase